MNEIAYAFDSIERRSRYTCNQCGESVLLKKGSVRAHHFSHKVGSLCASSGESYTHSATKTGIYKRLKEAGFNVKLEHQLNGGERIADVCLFNPKGNPILAIEIQRSDQTVDQMYERTKSYSSMGMSVLWVLPWSDAYDEPVIKMREWHKWINSLYYGKIYVACTDGELLEMKLGTHKWYKPYKEYYKRGGRGEIGHNGGHEVFSKNKRKKLDLIEVPYDITKWKINKQPRQAWHQGNLRIPQIRLPEF
jgi:competence protein CoiA